MRAACLLLSCSTVLSACVIGGTARDAGSSRPLPRTRVFARPFEAAGLSAVLRVTDAQGGFCFEQLTAGIYEVVAEKPGYLVTVFGARPGSNDGIPFEVGSDSKMAPLDIRMPAGATIAGTVLDVDGEPMGDAHVELSRKVWEKVWTTDQVRSGNSDEQGEFRFTMLPPGTYYISATENRGPHRGPMLDEKGQPVRDHPVETFYSGSYSFAHATPIAVRSGEENTGLIVTMLRPASRRLSGSLGAGLRPGSKDRVLTLQIEGGMGGNVDVAVKPDGTFSADGLAAAEYEYEIFNADAELSGKVDLSAGDVSGLVIEPRRMVELQVSAHLEGRDEPAGVVLSVHDWDGSHSYRSENKEGGGPRFRQIPAGVYRFSADAPGLYAKQVRVDGKAQPTVWLDLRQVASANVEVVFGAQVAAIEGRVEAREGETRPLAITVVAVDETRSGATLDYQSIVADQAGDFDLPKLAPGKWRLFAIQGFDEGPWGSPDLAQMLRDKSVAVEVGEGETKKAALRVIGTAEWEAALRRMGM